MLFNDTERGFCKRENLRAAGIGSDALLLGATLRVNIAFLWGKYKYSA